MIHLNLLQSVDTDAVCAAAHGMVGIALGTTLFVFAENCSTLELHLTLPHPIDTLLWLGSPQFLVASDRSGQLHFIHVPSRALLISKQLPIDADSASNDAFKMKRTFVSSHYMLLMDSSTTLLFVTSQGLVVYVANMNLEQIEDALAQGNMSDLLDAKSQLRFECCSKLQAEVSGRAVDALQSEGQILETCSSGIQNEMPEEKKLPGKIVSSTAICGCTEQQLYIFAATQDGRVLCYQPGDDIADEASVSVLLTSPVPCSKLLLVCKGRYLVLLMTDGSLRLMCTTTGLYKECHAGSASGGSVVDAVLLPWTDRDPHPQLLVLTSSATDTENFMLKIVSLSGLDCEYELSVCKGSILVPLGESLEAMVFLEPQLSSLKVKTIIDGVPETRLRKLISKHKFNEAYEFAKMFGLDTSLVAKSKARLLLSQLNPNTSVTFNSTLNNSLNASTESLVEKLLKILDTIDDVVFVSGTCIETALPDITTTQTLLAYAARRLASSSSQKCENTDQLREAVGKLQHRLATFLCLYPSHVDVSVWERFSATSPLDLCLKHLSAGDLSIASCVWQRHQHEFSERVDCEIVERIFLCVPTSLPSADLAAWLPHNIADFLCLCPASQHIVIDWTITRMKRLEIREKQGWPDNALNIGTIVMAALERSGVDTCSAVEGRAGVKDLRELLRCLEQLRSLLRDHRLRVPLQQYMQSDAASVCCSVLQWLVCGEEVGAVVSQFLLPVICEGSRSVMDAVLQQFVTEQLAEVQQHEWSLASEQATLWEDKLHAVTRAIQDEQVGQFLYYLQK